MRYWTWLIEKDWFWSRVGRRGTISSILNWIRLWWQFWWRCDRNILTGSWFCLWDLNWTHMQIVVPPDWSPIQASGWVETSQGNLDDHKEMTIVVIREHPQHVFFPPSCLPSLWMSEACQRTLSSERGPCKPGQKFNWLFMIIHVSDCMC